MDCQKDFSKIVNDYGSGLTPYSVGFAAGLGLRFSLGMGKRVHEPIGVRVTLYPCKAVYPFMTLYLNKALYLDRAVYGPLGTSGEARSSVSV